MHLTETEKAICKKYSKKDRNGLVRCNECPLIINKRDNICKRNISKKEARKAYDYNV